MGEKIREAETKGSLNKKGLGQECRATKRGEGNKPRKDTGATVGGSRSQEGRNQDIKKKGKVGERDGGSVTRRAEFAASGLKERWKKRRKNKKGGG